MLIGAARDADGGDAERQIYVAQYRAFGCQNVTEDAVQGVHCEVVLRCWPVSCRPHEQPSQQHRRKKGDVSVGRALNYEAGSFHHLSQAFQGITATVMTNVILNSP